MSILVRLSSRWKARRRKPLGQLLSVEFDEEKVRLVAHGQMEATGIMPFVGSKLSASAVRTKGCVHQMEFPLNSRVGRRRSSYSLSSEEMSPLARSWREGIFRRRSGAVRWGRLAARRVAGHRGRVVDYRSLERINGGRHMGTASAQADTKPDG